MWARGQMFLAQFLAQFTVGTRTLFSTSIPLLREEEYVGERIKREGLEGEEEGDMGVVGWREGREVCCLRKGERGDSRREIAIDMCIVTVKGSPRRHNSHVPPPLPCLLQWA